MSSADYLAQRVHDLKAELAYERLRLGKAVQIIEQLVESLPEDWLSIDIEKGVRGWVRNVYCIKIGIEDSLDRAEVRNVLIRHALSALDDLVDGRMVADRRLALAPQVRTGIQKRIAERVEEFLGEQADRGDSG